MIQKFQTFSPASITVEGEIGRRLQLTADKILNHLDIDTLFARHFRTRLANPEVPGEFTGYGMLLDAMVKASSIGAGGSRMKERKDQYIADLMGTQTPDGGISIFAESPGMWDNHEQAYILQAFANDYLLSGNREPLESALRLGSYLIRRKTDLNLGLEEAFLLLYEASGEKKFLDYCLNEFQLTAPLEEYDRIVPVNGTAHVYTSLARVLAQLKLEELTGDTSGALRTGAHKLRRKLLEEGFSSISGSCTGGGFWGEIWDRTQSGVGRWGETCASAYALRFAARMLRLEGDTVYGDWFERILFNAFFGAQSEDGLRQRYFIPFNEPGEWYSMDTYCCPNNFRRMMFELPGTVYFRSGDGVLVNLYTNSKLKTEAFEIHQTTEYPDSEEILLTVKSNQHFPLLFRIPSWCHNAEILLEGKKYTPDAGSCFRLEQQWQGSTEIRIHFPAPVRYIRGTMAQEGRIAVMRGPCVYAVEMERNQLTKHEIDLLAIEQPEQCSCTQQGIRIPCCIPNKGYHPREVLFTRFSAEKRTKTYFSIRNGNIACTEEDCLLRSPEKKL